MSVGGAWKVGTGAGVVAGAGAAREPPGISAPRAAATTIQPRTDIRATTYSIGIRNRSFVSYLLPASTDLSNAPWDTDRTRPSRDR